MPLPATQHSVLPPTTRSARRSRWVVGLTLLVALLLLPVGGPPAWPAAGAAQG